MILAQLMLRKTKDSSHFFTPICIASTYVIKAPFKHYKIEMKKFAAGAFSDDIGTQER